MTDKLFGIQNKPTSFKTYQISMKGESMAMSDRAKML
jgi:hypothetical protein